MLHIKVDLNGYGVGWRARVSSLILAVCVWLKIVGFLLFGPHGCIQTPLDQQLFMSEDRKEDNQIRFL